MDPLLTIRTVASLTGMSEGFFRKLIARRGIRAHRLGRRVRIAERDLQDFLAARAQEVRERAVERRAPKASASQ